MTCTNRSLTVDIVLIDIKARSCWNGLCFIRTGLTTLVRVKYANRYEAGGRQKAKKRDLSPKVYMSRPRLLTTVGNEREIIMKKVWIIAISAVIVCAVFIVYVLLLTSDIQGAPVPFSADWAHYVDGDELLDGGKYYASAKAIRLEGTEGGNPYVIIHHFSRKVSMVIYVPQREYMQVGIASDRLRDEFGLFGSPCPPEARESRTGRETLDGRDVEKWICTYPDGMTETVWYDIRLEAPIRIDVRDDSYIQFTNIVEGPQPATLFAPPAGFTRFEAS